MTPRMPRELGELVSNPRREDFTPAPAPTVHDVLLRGAVARPVPASDTRAVGDWLARVGSPIAAAGGYLTAFTAAGDLAILATVDGAVADEPACLLRGLSIERAAAELRA